MSASDITWLGNNEVFETYGGSGDVSDDGTARVTVIKHGPWDKCIAAKIVPNGTDTITFAGITAPLRNWKIDRKEGNVGVITLYGETRLSDFTLVPGQGTAIETTIKLTFTPRNITLARPITVAGSDFNYSLFEFWRRTEDWELKKEYKAQVPLITDRNGVRFTSGKLNVNDMIAGFEIVELDADTKAIAQRHALGMTGYEQYYPVVTREIRWDGVPGHLAAKPGYQQEPPSVPGVSLSEFTFICSGAEISKAGRLYITSEQWTGVPDASKPEPEPTGWGDGPIDLRYYPKA